MHCSSCGHEISEQDSFCRACGKKLQSEVQAKGTVISRFWPHAIIAVLLVAVAGLGLRGRAFSSTPSQPLADKIAPSAPMPTPTNQPPARVELTADELYQRESPGVVLIEQYNGNGLKVATGSGFVVGSGGMIATNYHVIRGASTLRIRFASGAVAEATGVLGYDPTRDIALLATGQNVDTALKLADSDHVKIGEHVFALGSPRGLQNSISEGIISSIRSGILQTTAPISPGSSGGALFNSFGEVIGITSAVMVGAGTENLNFAIPINAIKPYLLNASPVSLATVATDNAATVSVASTSVMIPARQMSQLKLEIRPDMSSAILVGTVDSSGGLDGKSAVSVTGPGGVLFESGQVTHVDIHLPLTAGVYVVDFSNSAIALPRKVDVDLKLSYTR